MTMTSGIGEQAPDMVLAASDRAPRTVGTGASRQAPGRIDRRTSDDQRPRTRAGQFRRGRESRYGVRAEKRDSAGVPMTRPTDATG